MIDFRYVSTFISTQFVNDTFCGGVVKAQCSFVQSGSSYFAKVFKVGLVHVRTIHQ